jgi:hypothetical protein
MVRNHRDSQENERWRINREHASLWRSWDGEVVVYDDLSGDTMKLDVIVAEAFNYFLDAPATQVQLVEYFASVLDLDADLRLQHLAGIAIGRLADTGLIEPDHGSKPLPADKSGLVDT